MIYLLKAIICAAFFLSVYLIFLEKEKMHQFNRFYLLLSVIASFLIPLVTFEEQHLSGFPIAEDIVLINEILPQSEIPSSTNVSEYHGFSINIYQAVYFLVSAILFIRFTIFLILLFTKTIKNKTLGFSQATLVLIEDKLVPHSFLRYIFINKKEFESGRIPNEILVHEKTHVDQKHSIDVLMIELLIILFWFNPVLYLYRKAIQLNHEFLADEAVIKSSNNVHSYQSLLVSNIRATNAFPFSSQFNFSITKKRFIMMKKTKSATRIMLKQVALIPVILLAIYLFSDRISAQNELAGTEKSQVEEKPANNVNQSQDTKSTQNKLMPYLAPATIDGVTEKQILEYEEIVSRYKSSEKNWWVPFKKEISISDKERLEFIFLQMSRAQQVNQTVKFMKYMVLRPKVVPTDKQLESWKDDKMYGVWIDGKRIGNKTLEKYDKNDFSKVFVSGLAKNAKNYGKHYYQVNLMTNEYYSDYNKRQIAKKGSYKMVYSNPPKPRI